MNSFLAVQDIGPIGPDRNWKGIGISLLVILVVLSLIGLSIVLLSKGKFFYKLMWTENAGLFFCPESVCQFSAWAAVLSSSFEAPTDQLLVCCSGGQRQASHAQQLPGVIQWLTATFSRLFRPRRDCGDCFFFFFYYLSSVYKNSNFCSVKENKSIWMIWASLVLFCFPL